MSDRDQKILLLAAPMVLALMALLIFPAIFGKASRADDRVQRLEEQRSALLRYRDTYLQYAPKGAPVEKGGPNRKGGCGPGPLAFFGETARRVGIRDKVVEMKPKDEPGGRNLIQVRLDKITIGSLSNLLFQIENSSYNFRVDTLSVEPNYSDRAQLKVSLTASCM